MLNGMPLRTDWRPRERCSSRSCVAPPTEHFRLEGGSGEMLLSLCEACAWDARRNVPVGLVLVPMSEDEVRVAEVISS